MSLQICTSRNLWNGYRALLIAAYSSSSPLPDRLAILQACATFAPLPSAHPRSGHRTSAMAWMWSMAALSGRSRQPLRRRRVRLLSRPTLKGMIKKQPSDRPGNPQKRPAHGGERGQNTLPGSWWVGE